MGKKRKIFTKEFKEDAVNYWQDSGRPQMKLLRHSASRAVNIWLAGSGRYSKRAKMHSHSQICENLLARNFSPIAENQTWCGDTTYVRTDEDWLYLAVVIDLFSRKVTNKRMKTDLVISAFKMAWKHRGADLSCWSRQGFQTAACWLQGKTVNEPGWRLLGQRLCGKLFCFIEFIRKYISAEMRLIIVFLSTLNYFKLIQAAFLLWWTKFKFIWK